MIKTIGAVFKYSVLVLVILVLSHIIEVRGVTLSQHVLNAMNWVTGFSPKTQINHITTRYSDSIKQHLEQAESASAPEVSAEDQKALNRVIEKAAAKR